MFKKIQAYLLTHYPLLWQSKFVPMLIIGIIAWVVAYSMGYLNANLNVIQNIDVDSYYTHYFVSIQAIAGIIIYVLWALYFFRTNALFQFYPLRKNYLLFLFIQILVPLFLLLSLYYPFTEGVYSKTKNILSEKELMAESKIINRAYPFLVVDKDDYKIEYRVYPSPFPMSDFHRDDNVTNWTPEQVYYKPRFINGKIDTSNNYYSPASKDPVTLIDGYPYLFYKSHTLTETIDACHSSSYEIIDSLIRPAEELGLHYYAIQNFSSVFIDTENWKKYSVSYSEDIRQDHKSEYYQNNIAPFIFNWIRHEDADSIFNCIETFKSICIKYKIEQQIPSRLLVNKLMNNHFKIDGNLTFNGLHEFGKPDDDHTIAEVDLSGIKMIYKNYATAKANTFNTNLFLILVMFALGIAACLLIAFCIDFISILISVPITGIVIIVCGLITYFSKGGATELVTFYFIIVCIIAILGYYAIHKKGIGKRQASILLCLGFYSLPFIAATLLYLIEVLTTKSIIICNREEEVKIYSVQIWHMIVLFIMFFILYLPLLKKLRSKEE